MSTDIIADLIDYPNGRYPQVPLDYSDPGRRTIELALIKRAATDPGRRIGTLFFNPGGPGEVAR
jgi:hypothetical protein